MFATGERVDLGVFFLFRGTTYCLLIILALFSVASCESTHNSIRTAYETGSETNPHDSSTTVGKPVSRIVEEIAAFEPGGYALAKGEVDPLVFELLKSRLIVEIEALAACQRSSRVTASAPTGSAGLIDDLAYDEGANTISWSYINVGDYDSSGEVGVPDITPIAQNYLADTTDGQGNDVLEAWIDGDGDGEVGISDITPIAQGYLNNIAHYDILTCDTIDGQYSFLASIDFTASGDIPQMISNILPSGALAYVAVQPTDALGNPGEISLPVEITTTVPGAPNVISIEPATGGTGSEVEFIAVAEGYWLFDYAWDFGGGATPDTSTDKLPVVTLGAPGTYDASLTLTNSIGETTYDFTLTVTDANVAPVTVLNVDNYLAAAPLIANFDASNSTDSDGTVVKYDWDTDGDGVFELADYGASYSNTYTEFETYQVGVRVTDDDGATSYEYVTVNVIGNVSDDIGEFGTTCAYGIVNGNPALVYTEADAYDAGTMYYVRALDTGGETWGTPVAITSAGFPGSMSGMASLAVINGNPAIAYFCETTAYPSPDQGLFFVRANDADGTTWGTPLRIDDAYRAGTSPTLFVSYGYPAIGYQRFDSTDFEVCFVMANDSDGITWGTIYTVDSIANSSGTYGIGAYTCAADIGNNPALLYSLDRGDPNDATTEVRFVRATDTWGTTWGTPVTLYGAGLLMERPFLLEYTAGDGTQYPYATFLVDADTDAVATDFQTLNYVATDQTGTTWSDVTASDPPGSRSPSALDRTISEEPLEGAQLIKTEVDAYGFNSYTARIYYASSGSNVTVEAHCEASEVSPGFPFGIRKTASRIVKASHWIPGYVIKVEASCQLSEGIHLTAVVTFIDYLSKVRVVTLKEWDYFNFNGEDDEEEEEG